jgi:creatinine amidohydrolase
MRVRVLVILAAITSGAQGGPLRAQQPSRGLRLSDITSQQASDVLRSDTVVVIPLGAGSNGHWPHLTLGTDAVLADYLARRVADGSEVVVAPLLPYHHVPTPVEYPGSASLTLETARTLTTEVAASLGRSGPRRYYVLNTSSGAERALAASSRALALQGILLRYSTMAVDLDRTSMMLYVDPASVDMRRAPREAAVASREKGQAIVEALVASLKSNIEDLRRAPPPSPSLAPAPTSASGAPQPSGLRASGCTPGDERAVRQMADAFTYYWSNADSESISSMWSREGDIVHPDGSIERGREVIRANRTALFLRPEYRGSKHPLTIGMIRCLNADVAVADGKWELRGVSDEKGKPLPTFEGQFTIVTKRGDEAWLIEAYRYTQKPAAAPMPTLLKRPGFPGGQ